ncbi:hypothetical protein SAMN06264364_1491 [Quadrisphaera granulorum]|uniref:D-mannose binding lectin n=1 Tax=Quadrisphaera granulorum TaxID=317664 RepID=A0A315ZKX5_9ACTN|nr:hypothetical protein [Quadrisphaera granulorum]PWJ46265.1 hypothetical protein BXY45_1491 [Quadrisphaera granulorum]SZE99080.1 hypothetical protein SAMN06264364_1491 [Quadrisphaera granulorum]
MLRSTRSIRGLLTGALLALAVTIPAAAAHATPYDPAKDLTVFDVAPKGSGWGCDSQPTVQMLGNYKRQVIQCVHINWGKRDVPPLQSSVTVTNGSAPGTSTECHYDDAGVGTCTSTDIVGVGEEWIASWQELPDPTIYGTWCDQGMGPFDALCIKERKTKQRIPDSVRRNSDRTFAGIEASSFVNGFEPGLVKGGWLMSQNGRYGLTFQGDGNLVAYGPKNKVLWSSGTWGHPRARS